MRRIGEVSQRVIDLLELNIKPNTPIFLGDSNIEHMKTRHLEDYEKYNKKIIEILKNPDYVGLNPVDGSIEYIKHFITNDFVKIVVRISVNSNFFARSIYRVKNNRINNFIKNGSLKKY